MWATRPSQTVLCSKPRLKIMVGLLFVITNPKNLRLHFISLSPFLGADGKNGKKMTDSRRNEIPSLLRMIYA